MWYNVDNSDNNEEQKGKEDIEMSRMMSDIYINERYGYLKNRPLKYHEKYSVSKSTNGYNDMAIKADISIFWFIVGIVIISVTSTKSMRVIFGFTFEAIALSIIAFEYMINYVRITRNNMCIRYIVRLVFYIGLMGLCFIAVLATYIYRSGDDITGYVSDLGAYYNRVLFDNSYNPWEIPESLSHNEKTMFMKLANAFKEGGCKSPGCIKK